MKVFYVDRREHRLVCEAHNRSEYGGRLVRQIEEPDTANCFYCLREGKKGCT